MKSIYAAYALDETIAFTLNAQFAIRDELVISRTE
jgi:hypothetical protein